MSTIDGFNATEKQSITNHTVKLSIAIENGDDSLRFIFVPLAVLLAIMVLSALVYLMARNRRNLVKIYKQVKTQKPLHDDPWDIEDNDDPTECLLSGKLQINTVYDTYQTASSNGRRELYT